MQSLDGFQIRFFSPFVISFFFYLFGSENNIFFFRAKKKPYDQLHVGFRFHIANHSIRQKLRQDDKFEKLSGKQRGKKITRKIHQFCAKILLR